MQYNEFIEIMQEAAGVIVDQHGICFHSVLELTDEDDGYSVEIRYSDDDFATWEYSIDKDWKLELDEEWDYRAIIATKDGLKLGIMPVFSKKFG
jgi:hypothetical protein